MYKENTPYEELEPSRIRQVPHAYKEAQHKSWDCSHDDVPRQRPVHSPFFEIAVHCAWDSHNIEHKVRWSHGRTCESQDTHLKRENEKGSRNTAHGSEIRNDESHERWNPDSCFDPGYREIHSILLGLQSQSMITFHCGLSFVGEP